MHNEKCYNAHFGEWMIEADYFHRAVSMVKTGAWKMADEEDIKTRNNAAFAISPLGTAVISLNGPLMKAASKFGGTSTVQARNLLRQAAADPSINSILLSIDSPGGTVAGTSELATEVRNARQAKPVFAQIDDLGASAAYWVASQAEKIFSNEMGQIGSIGTIAVLEDMSKMADMQGIKIHVVSTGEYKGAGTPGAPITEEHLAYFQQRVNDLNQHFLQAVKQGRGMGIEQVRKLADGKVHIAAKAVEMGLIDGVQGVEATLKQLAKEVKARAGDAAFSRRARAQLAIEDME
jgi:signal peptide peptidase SppA